jgi:putative ATP-dependent endonuclease of OLD family
MYLSQLKLWNFRQFGQKSDDLKRTPDLIVNFKDGLNLLVGENDSGKSTVVDAINYIVVPHSHEYLRIGLNDFYLDQKKLRIECIFTGFSIQEAKTFYEFLSFDEEKVVAFVANSTAEEQESWLRKNIANMYLRLFLEAEVKNNSVSRWYKIKAGADDEGITFDGEVRDYLCSMYLKPLRNAEYELKARPGSRLSQVLSRHKNFSETIDNRHSLTKIFNQANEEIRGYFEGKHEDKSGHVVHLEIHGHLKRLFSQANSKQAKFDISDPNIDQVLQKLNLELKDKKSGLGALNILFIAVELLHLKKDKHAGLHLGIIEEAEAHLHTQAQLRILKYLQGLAENKEDAGHIQLLVTTHSPHIASEINVSNLILFNEGCAFSLDHGQTKLEKADYAFLERFLDATKANLFFAEGVIIVEGDAENLLIPTIAQAIGRDLIDFGVSIVNVGHKGLFRYAKILLRNNEDEATIKIPVACIKDNDVAYERKKDCFQIPYDEESKIAVSREIKSKDGAEQNIHCFVSPNWTLEYDIALDKELREDFYKAVLYAKKAKEAKGNIYITDEKKGKADTQVQRDFKKWEGLSDKQIAYNIYQKSRDNKSITAQFYAELVKSKIPKDPNSEESIEFLRKLENSNLKYIIDAIRYATKYKPFPAEKYN